MNTSAERARFRRQLLSWFDKNQRDLPWRKRKTRYRVWVSEIMLQQTQVVTVIDYYRRFLGRFPSVRKLAEANESDVLKMWEGLGYYRRARQMHAAAIKIVTDHAGKFPATFDEVLALPGIGRYTAGAILSIADDQPLPILEGNTIRVYSRLLNFRDDVTDAAGQRVLWDFAGSLVTKNRPGDLNQALMELGSEICRVQAPACRSCPVVNHCTAFQFGEQETLPNKGARKTTYEDLQQAAVVIRKRDRVVIRLCGPHEHWTGLWDFPRFAVQAGHDPVSIERALKQQTGLSCPPESFRKPATRMKHAVTRFRITLDCYFVQQAAGRLKSGSNLRWVPIEDLAELAMSATGRKIADRLR